MSVINKHACDSPHATKKAYVDLLDKRYEMCKQGLPISTRHSGEQPALVKLPLDVIAKAWAAKKQTASEALMAKQREILELHAAELKPFMEAVEAT